MKTIPFDIEKAKAGAKVVTRAGGPVRLFAFDIHGCLGEVICGVYRKDVIDMLAAWMANGNFNPFGNGSDWDLMLAVEPQFREWTEIVEVPLGAFLRAKNNPGFVTIITEAEMTLSVVIHGGNGRQWFSASIVDTHEYSIDGGKTWQVCGVAL